MRNIRKEIENREKSTTKNIRQCQRHKCFLENCKPTEKPHHCLHTALANAVGDSNIF